MENGISPYEGDTFHEVYIALHPTINAIYAVKCKLRVNFMVPKPQRFQKS